MMRRLLAICAILLAIGCGDSTAPAGVSVAGTWSLQSMNGYPIPYVSTQGNGDKIELTSDVITATSSGTFTQVTIMTTTVNGDASAESIPDAGTYSVSGNRVTFTFTSGSPSGTGTIGGNTMTVPFNDVTLIYTR